MHAPSDDQNTVHSVLYMEDDAVVARVVQRALEKAGFTVESAADGVEGLAKLAYHRYTVVLLDYNMPKHNGLEVMRIMEERNIRLPIVMLTGSGDELVAVEAMKRGAADYVVKDSGNGYLTLLPAILERAIRRHQAALQKQQWEEERERLIVELQAALAKVKQLGGLLPVCSSCKKIRDDDGYWQQVEEYLYKHQGTEISHALCPVCTERIYGQRLQRGERPS